MQKARQKRITAYRIIRHPGASVALSIILLAIAVFFIVEMLSLVTSAAGQGYTVTRVDGLEVNEDNPLIDAAGSDEVVPLWKAPPKAIVEYLLTYLLFIGGPAGLFYAFPVLGRLEKKALLRNQNRNSIYDFIKANPGCTREDINKRQSINIGTVYHHVAMLELWGLIGYEGKGKFKRIYAGNMLGSGKQVDRIVCAHIQNDMARALLGAIMRQPGINPKALVRMTERDDSTIHWHLKRFSQDCLITIENDGIYRRCFVSPDFKPVLEKYLNTL